MKGRAGWPTFVAALLASGLAVFCVSWCALSLLQAVTSSPVTMFVHNVSGRPLVVRLGARGVRVTRVEPGEIVRIETTEDEVRGTATGAAVASVETDGATTPLYLGYIDGMIHYRYVVVVNRTGRPTVNGMASTSQSVRP